jgi:hypothetical protein
MSLSTDHCHNNMSNQSLPHQPIQPITISSMKIDPLSSACNSCQYHQEHISNHMLNITNTCLYQACTNITTYHHNICVLIKYQPVPCINMYHQRCTTTSAPTMHQPCTSTMYMHINMCQPCANHALQPCTSICANHALQPCTSTNVPYRIPYHVPQTICHEMYINHIPYQTSIMYHIPYQQPYADMYHVINEACQRTNACPSCIHHHTT